MDGFSPLKILYVADLTPNASSLHRLWALERLGHRVIWINAREYEARNPYVHKIVHRVQAGPWVGRINRDILAMSVRELPDIFWADKVHSLVPETLDALRAMKIASVNYTLDNPYGPRRDPGWRLYMRAISHFDLHAVQRDSNLDDYAQHGARNVMKVQTSFEPTLHFSPPATWSDADRNRNVSFIGSPYDDRAAFLNSLWREHRVSLKISGSSRWRRALDADMAKAVYSETGEVWGDAYREAIWKSKINLSFLTHSNLDEFAHKSFEIAACGGFLLAERSAGHLAKFKEDEEAVFFTGREECVKKIQLYLPDEARRNTIAAAGHARALSNGYDNDTQMALVLDRLLVLDRALKQKAMEAASAPMATG